MVTLNFQISDTAWELLCKIHKAGNAEYRDPEWPTLESFRESQAYSLANKTEEWFLKRNFEGTYHIIDELEKYNLIDINYNYWHITYELTEVGKEMMKKFEIDGIY